MGRVKRRKNQRGGLERQPEGRKQLKWVKFQEVGKSQRSTCYSPEKSVSAFMFSLTAWGGGAH